MRTRLLLVSVLMDQGEVGERRAVGQGEQSHTLGTVPGNHLCTVYSTMNAFTVTNITP